jgi:tripartite-type tricarboxylate transporter receptor subunit TctC
MEPVTLLFSLPQVLVVPRNSPARDVAGLVAQARANPGKLNYASGGIGSGSHVLASAIAVRNGLQVVHVPTRSLTADIVPMMERGDVHFSFPVTSVVAGPIQQGTLRAIAVTSRTRLPQLPDVPTLAEAFKDERYATDSWNGLFVPAGTPAPIVRKLFDAAVYAVQSKQHLAAAENLLSPAATSRSPAEFGDFLRAESVKWREIVRDSGAKLD